MKILATEKFNQKLSSLDSINKDAFYTILNKIKDLSAIDTASFLGLRLIFNPNSIQTYKIGNLRVFLNFSKDSENNEIILLLDLTLDFVPLNFNRDPNINGSINPRINGSINPNINGSINPRINGSINPNINGSINPRINGSINPRINPSFDGFYLYNENLVPLEFVIPINNKNILLFFEFSGEQTKYAVNNSNNGFNVFDLNNNWIFHLESDSKNGFNVFDLNNNWIGTLK